MDDYYYDEYSEQIYEDDNFYDELPVQSLEDLAKTCAYPSITQIFTYSLHFFIWSLIYRLTTQTIRIPEYLQHLVSIICGSAIFYFSIGQSSLYCVAFASLVFVVFLILEKLERPKGFLVTGISLLGLLLGEWLTGDGKLWHQIRGTQMIVAMKVISIAFDMDAKRIDSQINGLRYFGYIFCPGNSVLGPWISISDYLAVYKTSKWTIRWPFWILIHGTVSYVFLVMSNCLITNYISQSAWKWIVAYRDAAAFRFSHYFISFLSQSIMITAGFGDSSTGFLITKPWNIELPRSLVQVVINWNIPMHIWLKTYVFRVMQPFGSFAAIFTTYVVSSLLHGINFQLAAVLLSLGIYTYVEYNLRKKLASIYKACIQASPCHSNCVQHQYKSNHWIVLTANVFFTLLTIVHLAYLGVMFEASTSVQEQGYSYTHTLDKWSALNFASHWIVGLCYFLCALI